MRKHLVSKVISLMEKDQDLIFLTGDLGFGSFEIIEQKFPDRFYNMGIAEQNMIGVSCGLSLAGKKVIVYSIANFSTLRVIEQIRNYPVYHDCSVLIVNGGAGFSYGQLGYTHHAVEDIPILKAIPQLKIFAPFNQVSVEEAIDTWYKSKGCTAYLRLEKGEVVDNLPIIKNDFGYLLGSTSNKNFILCYGMIVEEAIIAQKHLKSESEIEVSIIILNELKPLNQHLFQLVNNAKSVAFIEECSMAGGIGEHFFASCMINNIAIKYKNIFAVKDFISPSIGDQKYLRQIHNISSKNLIEFFGGNNA